MTTDGRFIAINLTEAEWRALRAIRPDPAGWLKQQVVQALLDAGYPADETEGREASAGAR